MRWLKRTKNSEPALIPAAPAGGPNSSGEGGTRLSSTVDRALTSSVAPGMPSAATVMLTSAAKGGIVHVASASPPASVGLTTSRAAPSIAPCALLASVKRTSAPETSRPAASSRRWTRTGRGSVWPTAALCPAPVTSANVLPGLRV